MPVSRKRYTDKKKRNASKPGGRRGSRFKRGFYQPVNESKYRKPVDTHMNSGPIPEYRSSWELVFMKYCDFSENIEYWGTESFAISYISPKDNQPHRYYVDFVFVTTSGDKHLVEIKPAGQKKCPINLAKWEAAERYCNEIGAQFSVVTEIELKRWGLL